MKIRWISSRCWPQFHPLLASVTLAAAQVVGCLQQRKISWLLSIIVAPLIIPFSHRYSPIQSMPRDQSRICFPARLPPSSSSSQSRFETTLSALPLSPTNINHLPPQSAAIHSIHPIFPIHSHCSYSLFNLHFIDLSFPPSNQSQLHFTNICPQSLSLSLNRYRILSYLSSYQLSFLKTTPTK
jgi:hypothetical protein